MTNVIYSISLDDKFSRDFALCNQIRRASISVVSNIAEGFGRDGDKEFTQFLSIAKGSSSEVYTQLYVALDQSYAEQEKFAEIAEKLEEVMRIISGLMKYLKQSDFRGSKFKQSTPKD